MVAAAFGVAGAAEVAPTMGAGTLTVTPPGPVIGPYMDLYGAGVYGPTYGLV